MHERVGKFNKKSFIFVENYSDLLSVAHVPLIMEIDL